MTTPTLVDVSPQPTLAQRRTVSQADIGPAMGEMLPAVFHAIIGQGQHPAGPPYSRYHSMPPEVDFEAGCPVVDPVEAGEGFVSGELPGGRAASIVHTGPYDGLGEAWQALYAWVAAEGHTATAAWEVYLTDPGQEPDPAKWQTRLYALVG